MFFPAIFLLPAANGSGIAAAAGVTNSRMTDIIVSKFPVEQQVRPQMFIVKQL
jgi:hypothetical protein